MSITTQFEDEKELIEPALRKFLYEHGLAEIRRRIPQAKLSEEEVERELEEIRRIKRETFDENGDGETRQFQIAMGVRGGGS